MEFILCCQFIAPDHGDEMSVLMKFLLSVLLVGKNVVDVMQISAPWDK